MRVNSVFVFTMLILSLFFLGCTPNDTAAQIKIQWDSQESPNKQYPVVYHIYYCAGDDTSLFPVKNNAVHQDIWDWEIGTTINNYFYVKNDGFGKFFRIGIIPYSWDGTPADIRIITFTRSKPVPVTGLQITFIP